MEADSSAVDAWVSARAFHRFTGFVLLLTFVLLLPFARFLWFAPFVRVDWARVFASLV